MTTPEKPAMNNFRDAYQVLQKHAQTLRNSTDPNIDDLLQIVNESVQAYKVCKQRIDAVEQALAQALEDQDIAYEQDTAIESEEDNDAEDSAPDIPF